MCLDPREERVAGEQARKTVAHQPLTSSLLLRLLIHQLRTHTYAITILQDEGDPLRLAAFCVLVGEGNLVKECRVERLLVVGLGDEGGERLSG